MVAIAWGAFYFLWALSTFRFIIHNAVLAFPIPRPRQLAKRKNRSKILIQYPIRNEPDFLVERFFKSLETIPVEERDRFLLQVLDDYDTALSIRPEACIETQFLKRAIRTGNKAGNLNHGLKQVTAAEYPYVIIYDADHQVEGKGIIEAAEILEANPKVACVQSRWVEDNTHRTTLSWLQQQIIGMHIEREQTFRSRYGLYPIFNGAGGLWSTRVVKEETNGWMERCVCEDTDISGIITMRGYQIYVLPTWITRMDSVETWDAYKKQQRRWIKGNGQQLQLHFRHPEGWGLKKLYWISWLSGFALAFMKYVVPVVMIYKYEAGIEFNWFDKISIYSHVFVWLASLQTWDNRFHFKRLLIYPSHFIWELRILHHQIWAFWVGFFKWREVFEFEVTDKVAPRAKVLSFKKIKALRQIS